MNPKKRVLLTFFNEESEGTPNPEGTHLFEDPFFMLTNAVAAKIFDEPKKTFVCGLPKQYFYDTNWQGYFEKNYLAPFMENERFELLLLVANFDLKDVLKLISL